MATKETALTIKRNFKCASQRAVKQFMGLPTGNVCDAQGRIGALDYRIKPVSEMSRFCGTALSVGYQDTVVVDALKANNIALSLTPAGTTVGVAEHTVLLTLAACKRLPYADSELRRGRRHINSLRPYSFELFGRTMGYLGMGRIGQETAKRFKAFGTEGIYCDPYVTLPLQKEEELGLQRLEFDKLLTHADILTLHVPSRAATYHLIDASALGRMKTTAIIINTSRGSVIDEAALSRALKEGKLAGAGLDVFEEEPFRPDNPLAAMPNVVLTPHISAGTRDALKTKMRALFQNIRRFFNGEPLENQVDL